ncbi:Ion channel [Ancylostoma caninum]|uniref:Ion channel n=1 Tax=Ancylostoma caninum TaxID=29170 RepID=A0A368FAF5_ANCCA|nr:Ion channel [Ancylostoma caninum]
MQYLSFFHYGLRIRLFNVFIKLLSCVLYCVRVVNDSRTLPAFVTPKERPEGEIRYEYLIWVDRNDYLWLAQTIVAFISIAETIIIFYISYQGNIFRLLINVHFLLELVTSFPFAITIFQPKLRQLFVPVFLNCWLAKGSLQAMMNDLNRGSFMNQSALFRQLLLLFAIMLCLIFTGMCSIEHLQRGGERQFDLFTSFYFVMVTFSTVGYGDWYPDTWMSRLCVVSFICVALVLLPSQRIQVILLSPAELDTQTRLLLKIPLYHERVHYIRGSALRDEDLERARLSSAQACFILSARHQNKKIVTDEHTILRSWAVKDFAPHVKQYVQIFRAETKMHIEHAGISTFITLLMHTSRGEEGKKSTEPWHKVYGFHSGNEIYMIRAEDSKFFGDFIGKSFTYASFHAHRTYGIGLIGLKTNEPNAKIRLNPGVSHVLQGTDILYYMGLTNEESLYDFRKDLKDQRRKANLASTIANIDEVRLIDVPANGSRRPSIAMVMEGKGDSSSDSEHEDACTKCNGPCIQQKIQRTYPQVRTYIGTSNTVCHMLKEKRPLCCLQLDKACEHCPYTSAYEYSWTNKPIILAADRTSSGMYNLIIPLRAYYRPVHELHPIVLLLELEETASPNPAFLDAVSYFPGIYWMQGKISVLDNLLRAGVSRAEHVVVVKETASLAEEHFADCNTIITVQKIHRMFPRLRMITELTHASNMRFVQFDAHNPYSLAQSRFEKFTVTSDDLWIQTYGRLYQKLCSSVADIPIGIFRTKNMDSKTVSHDMEEKCKSVDLAETARERKKDMYNHIRSRMRNMGMSMDDELLDAGEGMADRDNTISFVIINPASDLQLEAGDIIYVLRSPVKENAKSNKINPRRGLRREHHVESTVDDAARDGSQTALNLEQPS